MSALATAEVTFPELSPSVADEVDAMLDRLGAYGLRWGSADAAILGRKLVRATVNGDGYTRGWLRRAERFLTGAR